jgi:hypothetical protein
MTDWNDSANCATVGVDFMFPEHRDNDGRRTAVEICDACDVREKCLNAALAEEAGKNRFNRYGIRGGCTPSQRARLETQRAAASQEVSE